MVSRLLNPSSFDEVKLGSSARGLASVFIGSIGLCIDVGGVKLIVAFDTLMAAADGVVSGSWLVCASMPLDPPVTENSVTPSTKLNIATI